MDFERPVIVTGLGRSGTSLTMGLLHEHGVWSSGPGTFAVWNKKGDFGNKGINKAIIKWGITHPDLAAEIHNVIVSQGYESGPWGFKNAVKREWCENLQKIFSPTWILVRRIPSDIYSSKLRVRAEKDRVGYYPKAKPNEPFSKFTRRWDIGNKVMDFYRDNHSGFDIWPHKLINLALVGGRIKYAEEDIHRVIQQYFDHYLMRSKEISSSTDGLAWTWGKAQSPYVLQWEDDWELLEKVNLSALILFMNIHNTDMIYLDRIGKPVFGYPKGVFKYLYGGFWEKLTGKNLVGSPALYKRKSMTGIVDLIDPQIQLGVNSTKNFIRNVLADWKIYTYAGLSGNLVQDIGRTWMKENNLVRGMNSGGRTWVEGK